MKLMVLVPNNIFIKYSINDALYIINNNILNILLILK